VLGRRLVDKSAAADAAVALPPRLTPVQTAAPGGVVVLPLHGVIAPRMNALSAMSGGTTFDAAISEVRKAAADPQISTIVLDWDSPGGSVAQATEFAQVLLQARTRKRIISVANHQMCSAAYWTGACATEVVATPSALVGSIGVYCLHENLQKHLEQEGVALTYIAAGKYKVDGNPSEPLSETAHARLQAIVDSAMGMFVADVAAGRGVSPEIVRARYGEGATLTAAEALAAGLIDRVETLDAVIARAVTTPPVQRASLAAADLQLGYDLAALGLGL
jgi:signal peptide peptidase SppA